MTVEITEMRNEPILIARYAPPFNPDEDLHQANAAIRDKLITTEPPLYRIEDVSAIEMSFAELVQAMATATEQAEGSILDSRVHSMLVGTSDMLRIAKDAMTQEQYGSLDVPLFPTVDDALAYVHQLMDEG